MKDIVIFGACMQGKAAAALYKNEGKQVKYFIDNDSQKWGIYV